MGVQDRDWWRERYRADERRREPHDAPRQTDQQDAGPTAGAAPRRPGGRRNGSLAEPPRWAGRLILALVLVLIGYTIWTAAAHQRSLREGAAAAPQHSAAAGTIPAGPAQLVPACSDPFPDAGARQERPGWRSGAAVEGPVRFVNETAQDRIVELLLADEPLVSMAVPASTQATLGLPSAAYQWRIRHGAAWCARENRFVREVRTDVVGLLNVLATTELTVTLQPGDSQTSGMRILLRDRPLVATAPAASPSQHVLPGNVLVLPRASNGHFYLDAVLDGAPTRFMVDTGATGVSVPQPLARMLGFFDGPRVVARTANGEAVGYLFMARELRFGPYVLRDVQVAAMPDLHVPLLGMSVLSGFRVEQTRDVMRMVAAR